MCVCVCDLVIRCTKPITVPFAIPFKSQMWLLLALMIVDSKEAMLSSVFVC